MCAAEGCRGCVYERLERGAWEAHSNDSCQFCGARRFKTTRVGGKQTRNMLSTLKPGVDAKRPFHFGQSAWWWSRNGGTLTLASRTSFGDSFSTLNSRRSGQTGGPGIGANSRRAAPTGIRAHHAGYDGQSRLIPMPSSCRLQATKLLRVGTLRLRTSRCRRLLWILVLGPQRSRALGTPVDPRMEARRTETLPAVEATTTKVCDRNGALWVACRGLATGSAGCGGKGQPESVFMKYGTCMTCKSVWFREIFASSDLHEIFVASALSRLR